MSGLTTVSSCCDHLLCKRTHNFYLVVWAFVLLCLSFSLTTWWKQYERLHYLIWFSASHHKIVHSWYSDCSDGSQAEPSWAEQITSLLVCLTQGQTTRGILLALSLLTSTQTSVNSSRWGWISNILVKMHSKQLVGSAHIDFWILLISILLRAFLVKGLQFTLHSTFTSANQKKTKKLLIGNQELLSPVPALHKRSHRFLLHSVKVSTRNKCSYYIN